jgi:hypothetical protein
MTIQVKIQNKLLEIIAHQYHFENPKTREEKPVPKAPINKTGLLPIKSLKIPQSGLCEKIKKNTKR